MEEMIKKQVQVNSFHGSHGYYITTNGDFIICDLGSDSIVLSKLESDCEKETENRNGEVPHATVIISHLHSDHIACFGELIEMHDSGKLILDEVYVPASVKDCAYIIDILNNHKDISVIELSGTVKEQLETLAMLEFCYGDVKEYKDFINETIKNNPKKYSKEKIKEAKDELLDEWVKGQLEETPKLTKTIKDRTKKELVNLFEMVKTAEENHIKISSSEIRTKQIGNVKIDLFKPSKQYAIDKFKTLAERNTLTKTLGIDVLLKYCSKEELSSLITNNEPYFNQEKIEEKLQDVSEKDAFMFKTGLHVMWYLQSKCSFNLKDEFFNDRDKLNRQIAGRLIAKYCNHEMNQENIITAVHDIDTSYLQPGDSELPEEILLYLAIKENPRIFPSEYISMIVPHHGSPTSGFFPLYKMFEEKSMLKYSERPVHITDNNEGDRKGYKNYTWLRENTIGKIRNSYFVNKDRLIYPFIEVERIGTFFKNLLPEEMFLKTENLDTWEKIEQEKRHQNELQEQKEKFFVNCINANMTKEQIKQVLQLDDEEYKRTLEKVSNNVFKEETKLKLKKTKESIKENQESQRELEKTYAQKLKEENEKIKDLEKGEISHEQNERGR